MDSGASNDLECDPRFPSGKWTGFFTDKRLSGKQRMDLYLTFSQSRLTGSGRDCVGFFVMSGSYQLEDGRCTWAKQYIGKHCVDYRGFNEGKGIWGTWDLTDLGQKFSGGFHIWPEGTPDPTQPVLAEEASVTEDESERRPAYISWPELLPALN